MEKFEIDENREMRRLKNRAKEFTKWKLIWLLALQELVFGRYPNPNHTDRALRSIAFRGTISSKDVMGGPSLFFPQKH